MVLLVSILLWSAVGVVAVLLCVLVMPVRIRAVLRTHPILAYRIYASVGGFPGRLRIVDNTRPGKPAKKTPERSTKKRRRRWPDREGARLGAALPKLVVGLIDVIRVDHVRADLEFGLPDPADTGVLYGFLVPFQMGVRPGQSISISPNFAEPRLAGQVDASIRIVAAQLLPLLARFAWVSWGTGR